jgi:hypothetical protein
MTCSNLTPYLLEARLRSTSWTNADFQRLVSNLLESVGESSLDWDQGAGEGWARILVGNQVVAIVRFDEPLVFLLDRYLTGSLANELQEHKIVLVRTGDMDSKTYKLDVESIRDIFPNLQWPYEAIDPGELSVLDLWWATV